MAIDIYLDTKGVPRVWPTGAVFCDGCETGKAIVRVSAKPPKDGYVARTMRLCRSCARELRNNLRKMGATL